MQSQLEGQNRTRVPAAPIVRRVRAWLDRECGEAYGRKYADLKGMKRASAGEITPWSPLRGFCEKVWPDSEFKAIEPRIRMILRGDTEHMEFALADRMLVAIHDTFAWLLDPELAEAYETVSLLAIDLRHPISEDLLEESLGEVRRVFLATGSARETAERLNVPRAAVAKVVRGLDVCTLAAA